MLKEKIKKQSRINSLIMIMQKVKNSNKIKQMKEFNKKKLKRKMRMNC